jgi:hypothetical protein
VRARVVRAAAGSRVDLRVGAGMTDQNKADEQRVEYNLRHELRTLADTKIFHSDTFKRARAAMRFAADSLDAANLRHNRGCVTDRYARDVCEGMYADKCNEVHKLHEALHAVYSLVGEDKQIETICKKAVRDTGGEWE